MGELGLSPDEFDRLTFGEYKSKVQGNQLKKLKFAYLIGLGFNAPDQLSQMIMLQEAIVRGEVK